MLLLPFKTLFLFAIFGVWYKIGNAVYASVIWAVASFWVALAVFLGLSYIQRSFWMIPGAALGGFLLIAFF